MLLLNSEELLENGSRKPTVVYLAAKAGFRRIIYLSTVKVNGEIYGSGVGIEEDDCLGRIGDR